MKKILLLGSSALKIGEAGEFDYSGSQAIKALKEEGYSTILVNPNIATIQTSEDLADKVYLLPVNPEFVTRIIEREKPDGIIISFGGQTALNCGVELYRIGILKKHNVKVLGTPVETVIATEDRDLFTKKIIEIGERVPESKTVKTVKDALAAAEKFGYPVMVRIGFALGGLGSGICADEKELKELAGRALSFNPEILVEESLKGWKEIEYEVVRDSRDNCITVCNMENFDPLGIHTGESIVTAPSQTLTNREYQMLRNSAIKVIRSLGIIGECNIQFALSPEGEEYRIIEVNARLSRSSALASKATGYPLAFVAAKIILGYGLHEIPNNITKVTSAFFEPSLDYIVVKIPRWDMKKFSRVSRIIGSGMKSVGEVMAIGRKFEEVIQKAVRMTDTGLSGLFIDGKRSVKETEKLLIEPTDERIKEVSAALFNGSSVDRIHELTKIDKWFLYKLKKIVETGRELKECKEIDQHLLLKAKQTGFSDNQIAQIRGTNEREIFSLRKDLNISSYIKQIDTLGGEYPARTNYQYLTYNASCDDASEKKENAVLVLGSGAYRIGSSVEFDWCSVNTVRALKEAGYYTIVLNNNPETVSTDYDESDELYFDEITVENILAICEKRSPIGVIISVGGQVANNLALELHERGVRILGTAPENIDRAEDRHKFSSLLDNIGIDQPVWRELKSEKEALKFAAEAGYPVIVRPSYVLSGTSMAVASDEERLKVIIKNAGIISSKYPVVISKFHEDSKEIEMDGVARNGEIILSAVTEHIENAGVHSGDATLVLPPRKLYYETMRKVKEISSKIAYELNINGPFNIQFLARNNDVKVIECNLRASRSFPFVSRVMNVNFIKEAVHSMMNLKTGDYREAMQELKHTGVKSPHFSYTRLLGADPLPGVDMASTGEVACIGSTFNDAFMKALIASGYKFDIESVYIYSGNRSDAAELEDKILRLLSNGVEVITSGKEFHEYFDSGGLIKFKEYDLVKELLRKKFIGLLISIPAKGSKWNEDEYMLRREAADLSIPIISNLQLAVQFLDSMLQKDFEPEIKAIGEYFNYI